MIADIIANFKTTLTQSVEIGGTTLQVASILTLDGTNIPNGLYGFTIGVNDKIEHFTAVNSGGILTDVKSVNFVDGAETNGFTKTHDIGDDVRITNHVALKRLIRVLQGLDGLEGTAPMKYQSTPTLSNANELATVGYVLSVVTGGVVTTDALVISALADEDINENETVYLKSNGRWEKTDAKDSAKSLGIIGIALETVTSGSGFKVTIQGIHSGSYTAGSKYYLSDIPGQLSTTAGNNVVFFGEANSAGDLIITHIPGFQTITAEEKQALAGTTGTPSTENKYVTEDNVYSGDFDQEQTTQDAEIRVGETNTTGQNNVLAQSFKAGRSKIKGVKLWKEPNAGTNAGDITVQLQADNDGDPSGTSLATVTISDSVYNALTDEEEFEAIFSTPYDGMIQGNLYWIVVSSSTADNSNHINLGTNSAGGYSNGSVKYKNVTDGWVDVSTVDLYFKTINGLNNQVIKTDENGSIPTEFSKESFGDYVLADEDDDSGGMNITYIVPAVGFCWGMVSTGGSTAIAEHQPYGGSYYRIARSLQNDGGERAFSVPVNVGDRVRLSSSDGRGILNFRSLYK